MKYDVDYSTFSSISTGNILKHKQFIFLLCSVLLVKPYAYYFGTELFLYVDSSKDSQLQGVVQCSS